MGTIPQVISPGYRNVYAKVENDLKASREATIGRIDAIYDQLQAGVAAGLSPTGSVSGYDFKYWTIAVSCSQHGLLGIPPCYYQAWVGLVGEHCDMCGKKCIKSQMLGATLKGYMSVAISDKLYFCSEHCKAEWDRLDLVTKDPYIEADQDRQSIRFRAKTEVEKPACWHVWHIMPIGQWINVHRVHDALSLSNSHISRTLEGYVKHGLVDVRRDPSNGRKYQYKRKQHKYISMMELEQK